MLHRLLLVAVVAASVGCGARQASEPVLLFAAASLQTAIDALVPQIEQQTGLVVVTSYAASSTLARQIEQGAPAGVFISADQAWMDYLQTRQLIDTTSRVTLLTNALVVVAGDAGRTVDLSSADSWLSTLGGGRLAVADPSGVPAGRYAKEALISHGVWEALQSQLAPGDSVRAALRLVARHEAPLGIVYRTDANADSAVHIVATFPGSSHTPIEYPAAVIRDADSRAARVLEFLSSATAREVFAQHGFGVGS
jgi:molybdate transport system substrate-binding protein